MARNQFGGFGGPNMQQLMRQAQKMQQDMIKMQEPQQLGLVADVEVKYNE